MRLVALLFALATCCGAFAQPVDFPSRPVRLLLPFPPGSGPDVVARLLGERLSKSWAQPVVVENRPGANGVIALDAARRASADGHELVLADSSHLAVNPHLYSKIPYDAERDFLPVTEVLRAPYFLIVSSRLGVASAAELIALAKARNGALSYGSIGLGSPTHLGVEVFKRAAGFEMLHVPFRDSSQLVAAGSNGEIALMMVSTVTAAAGLQVGKLKAIAVMAPARLRSHPDTPTVSESGGPAVEAGAWMGVLVPAATPAARAKVIHGQLAGAIRSPEFRERLAVMGFQATGDTPEEFAATIRAEHRRFGELVKTLGIRLD